MSEKLTDEDGRPKCVQKQIYMTPERWKLLKRARRMFEPKSDSALFIAALQYYVNNYTRGENEPTTEEPTSRGEQLRQQARDAL